MSFGFLWYLSGVKKTVHLSQARNNYQKCCFQLSKMHFDTANSFLHSNTSICRNETSVLIASPACVLQPLRCDLPLLSTVELIYKREGPVGRRQPISISVMAAWQYPAVPDVPPRADGALVSSAALLQRSLKRKQIHTGPHTCTQTHTHRQAGTCVFSQKCIIVFPHCAFWHGINKDECSRCAI